MTSPEQEPAQDDAKAATEPQQSRVTLDMLRKCWNFKKYSNKEAYPYIQIRPLSQPSQAFIAMDNEAARPKPSMAEAIAQMDVEALIGAFAPVFKSCPIADPVQCKCEPYEAVKGTKCFWIENKGASISNGVIIAFHGAGFVFDLPEVIFAQCELLSQLTGCVVIVVQYKKAPQYLIWKGAAVEEGVNVYKHFLEEKKIAADKIAIMGDSSGGGITLLMLQRLGKVYKDAGTPECMPKCVIVTSPWCHLQYDITNNMSDEEKANAGAAGAPEHRISFEYDSAAQPAIARLCAQNAMGKELPSDKATYNAVYGDFSGCNDVSWYFAAGITQGFLQDTLDVTESAYNAGCKNMVLELYPYMSQGWHVHVNKFKEAEYTVVRMAQFITTEFSNNELS